MSARAYSDGSGENTTPPMPYRLLKLAESWILTTSSHLEGYRVTEHIDIVSAECVFGMNILKDMFAGFRDFFGGRNKASQDALRDARVACLDELRREA